MKNTWKRGSLDAGVFWYIECPPDNKTGAFPYDYEILFQRKGALDVLIAGYHKADCDEYAPLVQWIKDGDET